MKTTICFSLSIVGCFLILLSYGYAGNASPGKVDQDRDTVFLKSGELVTGSICVMRADEIGVRDLDTGLRHYFKNVDIDRIVSSDNRVALIDAEGSDDSNGAAGGRSVNRSDVPNLILPSQSGISFGIGPAMAAQRGLGAQTGFGGTFVAEYRTSSDIGFLLIGGYITFPDQHEAGLTFSNSEMPIYAGIRGYLGGPTIKGFVGIMAGIEVFRYHSFLNEKGNTITETYVGAYPEAGLVFNIGGPISFEVAASYHWVNRSASPISYLGASFTIRFQLP